MTLSVKIKTEKIPEVKWAQKYKGWSQFTWSSEAYISESTIKRFLAGKRISIDCFRNIFKVIDIDNWQEFADWEEKDSTRVSFLSNKSSRVDAKTLLAPEQVEIHEIDGAIVVSGNFTKDNSRVIEAIIEQIKLILIKPNITKLLTSQDESEWLLLISGDFVMNNQIRIKALLKHLQIFLIESEITII